MGGGPVDTMEGIVQPAASSALGLSVDCMHAALEPHAALKTTALVSIQSASVVEDAPERKAVDLVAVIDRSGSMGIEGRLEQVKQTLEFAVAKVLREGDRLGLVTYDTGVHTDASPMQMTGDAKERVRAILKKLEPGSCTNLSGGLFEGVRLLQDSRVSDVASILLFTDGLANAGITNTDELTAALQSLLGQSIGPAQRAPPSVFTFGYGKDHSEEMLQKLAEAGNGSYYLINSTDDIPDAFGDAIGGLLSVLAQGIALTIMPACEGVTIDEVQCTYPCVRLEDGSYRITFGDMYEEETRDLLLSLSGTVPADASEPLIKCQLDFLDIRRHDRVKLHTQLCVERQPSSALAQTEVAQRIVRQSDRILVTRTLENASKHADNSDFKQATGLLNACLEQLQISSAAGEPQWCELVKDIEQSKSAVSSEQEYQSMGRKVMCGKSGAHSKQRSNTASGYMMSPAGKWYSPAVNPGAKRLYSTASKSAASALLSPPTPSRRRGKDARKGAVP